MMAFARLATFPCAIAALILIAIAAPSHPESAAASTFTVSKQADTADGSCDNDCSLREAIIAANASPGPDVITLPAGDYHLDVVGADEDAAATGDLDITDDLTINGAGAVSTIVDGMGHDRVIHMPGVYGGTTYALTISGITVRGGNPPSDGGGGIHNSHRTLTVSESVITTNTADYAGGIESLGDGATLVVIDSAVSGNTASGNAGGIFNNTGKTTISGSTISGNTAVQGEVGGIDNSGGVLTITNSTVSGNASTGLAAVAGGIKSHPTLNLDHVTITGNSAASGDGGGIIQFGGTVNLKDTIVAGNTGATGASDCAGTLTSGGYNLIENVSTGCTIAGDTTGNVLGQDPLLDPLADNGGATQTHALKSGSPAIDAGGPGCPPPVADQRGVARPQGTACDIGAFEAQPGHTQGDVDCSGSVTSVDALKVLRYVAQLPVNQIEGCPDIGTDVPSLWGDVDCTGGVTSVDALKILRYVASLPVQQTEPCPDIGTPEN